ncbi:Hypothetical protein NTJ_00781 [Nesidiocoris tenuis]|uniref:Plasma membrane calcium transporting P-type ATPase C-terminal domain-containing protein n=1 Tax=Nesidiocoris tenuis TaxID=355587 RepID=A0ABN7AAV8_9HEMI|nr:Hypothetical protein NTJ_00781 [Nesidiocoris tenuis]
MSPTAAFWISNAVNNGAAAKNSGKQTPRTSLSEHQEVKQVLRGLESSARLHGMVTAESRTSLKNEIDSFSREGPGVSSHVLQTRGKPHAGGDGRVGQGSTHDAGED